MGVSLCKCGGRTDGHELSHAVSDGDHEYVKLLTNRGVSVNVQDCDGETAVFKAADLGFEVCMDALIKAGADVNVKSKSGETALMKAVENTQCECVELLIKAGGNVNNVTPSGLTILMLAAAKGNKGIVELLLNAGANLHASDYYGCCALEKAAIEGNNECVDLIIRAGADVNKHSLNGYTPLMFAVMSCDPDIIKYLVSVGADVNAVDNAGETVLFHVVQLDQYKWAQLLIKLGADVNWKRNDGINVLTCAADAGAIGCLLVLFQAGARVIPYSRYRFNTPMLKVFQQQDIADKTKCLLFAAGDAGYNGNTDSDNVLFNCPPHGLSLKRTCRTVIRSRLMDVDPYSNLFGRVTRLGLPSTLASYLVYDIKLKIDKDYERPYFT